jgi:hypothetical protein
MRIMWLSGGLLKLEHVVVMIVYEYLAYKVSLGYVASSTCVSWVSKDSI